MSMSRIASRFTGTVLTRCRISALLSGGRDSTYVSSFSNQLLSPTASSDKVACGPLGLQYHFAQFSSPVQWAGFSSSSASSHPNKKENAHSGNERVNDVTNEAASAVDAPDQSDASISKGKTEPSSATEAQSSVPGTSRRKTSPKRTAFSESDSDSDLESSLSRDDLVKHVAEKEQLLGSKQDELDAMKDKVLRTLAEMENVKERTRRESENAKKFAIQNFAKSLLDVADNLARASSAAKESFSKTDTPEGESGSVQQLKVLLEGVEMTEKQLLEVFRKFGLERYDPINEEFDPNRHNAVFQVPDSSKPADHVAVVLKAGYMLHDRVIRPAEVGVTIAANN